jgi:Tol biopolymer transport system component
MNHRRRRALGAAALAASLAVITGAQSGAAGAAGRERIVFSSPLPGGGASVSVVSPDGSGLVGVDLAVDLEDINRTVWSHDGTRLLHSNTLVFDGNGEVVAFRPSISASDGTGLYVLTLPDFGVDMYCSAWSPDDSRILCAADGGVMSMRASDGGGIVQLTNNPYAGKDLAVGYSPDGTQLAFLRSKPGPENGKPGDDQAEREALFVAEADGTNARRLTDWGLLLAHDLAEANWSPDGLSFISVDRHGRLVKIAADGSNVSTIDLDLDGTYFAVTPDYSPDGTQIVAAVFRNAPADLYVANRDGSHAHAITDTSDATEWLPDWAVTP